MSTIKVGCAEVVEDEMVLGCDRWWGVNLKLNGLDVDML